MVGETRVQVALSPAGPLRFWEQDLPGEQMGCPLPDRTAVAFEVPGTSASPGCAWGGGWGPSPVAG